MSLAQLEALAGHFDRPFLANEAVRSELRAQFQAWPDDKKLSVLLQLQQNPGNLSDEDRCVAEAFVEMSRDSLQRHQETTSAITSSGQLHYLRSGDAGGPPFQKKRTPSGGPGCTMKNTETLAQTDVITKAQEYEGEIREFKEACEKGEMSPDLADRAVRLVLEYNESLAEESGEFRSQFYEMLFSSVLKKQLAGSMVDLLSNDDATKRPVVGTGRAAGVAALGTSSVDNPAHILKHVKQPSNFSGTGKDDEPVRRWLTSMSHYLNITKVPNALGVGIAVSYLRDDAQVYWFSLQNDLKSRGEDPSNWDVFRKYMVLGYGSIDPEHTARDRIARTRQTCTVDEYARVLRALFAELVQNPMAEQDKIYAFIHGLKPAVSVQVQVDPVTRLPWTSLASVVDYAIRLDNAYHMSRSNKKTGTAATPPVQKTIGGLAKRVNLDQYKWGDANKRVQQLREGDYAGDGTGWKNKKNKYKKFKGSKKKETVSDLSKKVSRDERKRRFRAGLCVRCAEPDHQKADCKNEIKAG